MSSDTVSTICEYWHRVSMLTDCELEVKSLSENKNVDITPKIEMR